MFQNLLLLFNIIPATEAFLLPQQSGKHPFSTFYFAPDTGVRLACGSRTHTIFWSLPFLGFLSIMVFSLWQHLWSAFGMVVLCGAFRPHLRGAAPSPHCTAEMASTLWTWLKI